MPLTVVADDLTGACDSGALFAGPAPVAVYADLGAVDQARDVLALDTGTRALGRPAAVAEVRRAARALAARLAAGRVFKKIDSTLRGHVAAEIEALLDATGRAGALLAAAFPRERRVVVGGRLLVDGVPVHESPIGRDPDFGGATSEVAALLRAGGSTRPVRAIGLETVRGDARRLARALEGAGGALLVADAETDGDLDALAAALADRPDLIAGGSAGLARALAARLGLAGAPPPLPEGRGWLVVAGSRHPAARAQVAALAGAGAPVLRVAPGAAVDVARVCGAIASGRPAVLAAAEHGPDDGASRTAMAECLAAAGRAALASARPDLIVATGGDTARALLGALGARRIDLAGVPFPGLALGELIVDGGPALSLLTKAGGFGAPDLLLGLLKGHP